MNPWLSLDPALKIGPLPYALINKHYISAKEGSSEKILGELLINLHHKASRLESLLFQTWEENSRLKHENEFLIKLINERND